jgi:GntR family transcriptional repressor for pyruvate dehydrogenase complex
MAVRQGSAGSVGRLDRETAAQQIVRRLTEAIAHGEFLAGEKLPPERELAASLGVSRPALREALQALSALRLVRVRHGDGIYITSLDAKLLVEPLQLVLSLNESAIEQIYQARVVLESAIAEEAAREITDEQVERLEGLLAEMEGLLAEIEASGDDTKAFSRLDVAIHAEIAHAVSNPFLTIALESITELGMAGRRFTCTVPGVPARSCHELREIVDRLRAHDPAGARQAMRHHILNVIETWSQESGREHQSQGNQSQGKE